MAKVMVVDDSPFSRGIIADALAGGGFEIVSQAGCLEEALQEFGRTKPDIVTMDIVMPGADGLECIRALKLEDPDVKVVIISSMKDDDLVKEARKLKVAGYVQKPVEADELVAAVQAAVAPDEIFAILESQYLDVFKDAFSGGMAMMTKTVARFDGQDPSGQTYTSLGVAVVIGIVGRYSGRMIFDLSFESARTFAKAALRREPKNDEEVLAMVAEFANIISGNACSVLNKKCKEFGLRVTPPSVFHGGTSEIITPNIQKKSVFAETDYGRMYLNIGFKQGAETWT